MKRNIMKEMDGGSERRRGGRKKYVTERRDVESKKGRKS